MSFTVPFFCASVAIVRRITWKVSLGNSSSCANPCRTRFRFNGCRSRGGCAESPTAKRIRSRAMMATAASPKRERSGCKKGKKSP
jgi:hypothetical protein